NILQLEVCKTDPETKCDIQLIVLFDLSKLQSGSPFLEKFSLKPKTQEQPDHYEFLEVEFKLSDVPGPPEQLISNANKNVVFSVEQSYEGTQKTSKNLDSFHFHCIKSFGPVLKVKIQNLDVRLGYELCPDEQDFLRKRKKVVADALYKLFNLGEELQEDE
ncbi:hypothetical protein E2320_021293, partial [Naja naja]